MKFLIIVLMFFLLSKLVDIVLKIGNVYINIFIYIRNIKFKIKSKYIDLITMHRDVDADYSPAVLSYLYNYKLEPKKDILATILNLYNKGIINIRYENNKYEFMAGENIDLKLLTNDEKYIYYTLISKYKRNFSADTWKKIVIDEYNKRFGISKLYKIITKEQIIKISAIITFVSLLCFGEWIIAKLGFPMDDPDENFFMSFGFFVLEYMIAFPFIWVTVELFNEKIIPIFKLTNKKLNKKEKEELIKWIKFQNFIKEYTLISEKKIEDIIIYEKYIPYAMVLNINKEYKNDEVKYLIDYYMKNISPNIKSHVDLELSKKSNIEYRLK